MNKSLHARLRAGLSAILMMFGVSAASSQAAAPQTTTSGAAGKAGIHPWLEEGERVEADVLVDGQRTARLEYLAESTGLKRRPAVVFDLPIGLKRLRLTGQLISPAGKAKRFDRTWKVVDLAAVSAPLYDRSLRWLDRLRGLQGSTDGAVTVETYDKRTRANADVAFDALEKRLGASLPAPLRELGEAYIEIGGDSFFVKPGEMETVTEALLGFWGYNETGENGLDDLLPPAVRARYDRSLLVFVEVGDGLGALAWDPVDVTVGEPTHTVGDVGNPGAQAGEAGQGVWFWLHEDSIAAPTLLLDDDYRPRDAVWAMSNVLQRLALNAEYSIEEGELAVDTAHPRNLLQLHFEEGKRPRLWLRSYDYDYGMY